MVDRNSGKSIIVTLLELLDRHVTTVSVLESRVAILEDERRSAVEMTRTKERALLELLDDMTTRIEELERRIDVPKVSKMSQTEEDEKVELEDKGVQANREEEKPRELDERTRIDQPAASASPSETETTVAAETKVEKPWKRHRSQNPFTSKRVEKREVTPEELMASEVQFIANTCTNKKSFAEKMMKMFLASMTRISREERVAYLWFVAAITIVGRAIIDFGRIRAYGLLIKDILDQGRAMGLNLEAPLSTAITNRCKEIGTMNNSHLNEKELIVNILCFMADLQKQGVIRSKQMIDSFSKLLDHFDQNNCGFARRILANLYKIDQNRLWDFSKNYYSEDDENQGNAVKFAPRTLISVQKVDLNLATITDSIVFGKCIKKAPIEVKRVAMWMFVEIDGLPDIEKGVSKLLNSLCWKSVDEDAVIFDSLRIHGEMLIHDAHVHVLADKMYSTAVMRALTAPPRFTSLFARFLALSGRKAIKTESYMHEVISVQITKTIFSILHTIVGAASFWQREKHRFKRHTKDCEQKVLERLASCFEIVCENGFFRVAWFLHCLRDCGRVPPHKIAELRGSLLAGTLNNRARPSQLKLLRKWLHELDKSGYVDVAAIDTLEKPWELEENFASVEDCRRLKGSS